MAYDSCVPSVITTGHTKIMTLLGRLNAGATPEELFWLAEELEEVLLGHFEDEEGDGGLFPLLGAEHPDRSPEIRALEAEHLEIVDRLEALVEAARALPADGEEFVSALAELDGAIRSHERRETVLLEAVFSPNDAPVHLGGDGSGDPAQ